MHVQTSSGLEVSGADLDVIELALCDFLCLNSSAGLQGCKIANVLKFLLSCLQHDDIYPIMPSVLYETLQF